MIDVESGWLFGPDVLPIVQMGSADVIRVRVGSDVVELKAYRGPDGLAVADPKGKRASRKLWREINEAAVERTKPQEYTPFRFSPRGR